MNEDRQTIRYPELGQLSVKCDLLWEKGPNGAKLHFRVLAKIVMIVVCVCMSLSRRKQP